MIIRMTVSDNDFTDVVEDFAKNLYGHLFAMPSSDNYKPDEYVEKVIFPKDKLRQILNPNNCGMPTKEEKAFVCECVRKAWEAYLYNRYYSTDSNLGYLLKEFRVSTTYTMHDKWENGEVVYCFITQRVCLTQ